MSLLLKNSNWSIDCYIIRAGGNWNLISRRQHNSKKSLDLRCADYSVDWQNLEISENSDQEQVRQAYLKLAKKYHPDSGSAEADSTKFKKIDESYRNLQKKFADDRHNRHKIEGEYGLYYEQKKGQHRNSDQIDDEEIEQDIQHVAPQHRQYLSFDGIGVGPPSQREKQHQAYRAAKLTENLLTHRISRLESTAGVKDVALRRNSKESKKIKTGIGIERLVEDLIQESMARGDFENLQGKGKPLKHDTSYNPYIDFTTHKMNQLLIDNGFTPEWILLGKEIREGRSELRRQLTKQRHYYGKTLSLDESDNWMRFLQEFKKDCDSLNRKINKFNLVVPSLYKQLNCFYLEKEAANVIQNFSEELYSLGRIEIEAQAKNASNSSNVSSGPSLLDIMVSMFKLS